MDEAPGHVQTIRSEGGDLVGLSVSLSASDAPDWAEGDPHAGPWLEYARSHHAPDEATLLRDSLILVDGAERSEVVTVGNGGLGTGRAFTARWLYVLIESDDEDKRRFVQAMGYERFESLDVVDPEFVLHCYRLDLGPDGLVGTTHALVYRHLGYNTGPPRLNPITRSDVVEALRNFHQPTDLLENPIAGAARGQARIAVVRDRIREALDDTFSNDPLDGLRRRVVEAAYIDPAGPHAGSARRLHLSRATYFRRLAEGVDILASHLTADYKPATFRPPDPSAISCPAATFFAVVDVRVSLLGPLTVEVGGRRQADWPRPAARRLVALLALAPGHAASREALVDRLFSHLPPDRGLRNLSKALSQARSVVGTELLAADSSTIRLNGAVSTDLEEVKQALAVMERPDAVRTALASAPDLLLEDMYEEWAQEHRWEMDALCRRAALELARTTDQENDWSRVATLVPTNEEAWSALLRHAAHRGRSAVTEVMHRCRLAWAHEGLGALPVSLETDAQRLLSTTADVPERITVGREGELATILARLDEGVPVLVVGPAGVGKTHLVGRVIDAWEGRGREVAVGTSSPEDTFYPFASLRAALTRLPVQTPSFLRDGGTTPELSPAQMAAETAHRLSRLSSPPLTILDDAHWADPALQAMLSPLAAQAALRRLPLLVAARSDEPGHPLAVWPSQGEVVVLRELSVADASTLARRLLDTGQSLDPAAAENLVRTVAERSGGNPLFLTELVRAVGSGTDQDEPLPERIESLIRSRLAALPPQALALVRVISVAGEHAGEGLVLRAAAEWGDDVLARLRATGIVAREGVRMSHPLWREYVAAAMTPEEVSQTHWLVAEHLQALAEVTGQAHHRAAAGSHLLAAYEALPRMDLAEPAVEGALTAGETAARSYAARSVIRILEPAHDIYLTLPSDRRLSLAGAMGKALLDLGEAWRLEGDETRAETWFQRALDIAQLPLERALCHRALASLAYRRGEMEKSAAVLRLGMDETDDELALAVLESELAWTWHRMGRYADALAPLESAARMLEDAGAWPDAVRALDYLGVTLAAADRPKEALDVLNRALAVNATADLRMRGILLMHRATTLRVLDRTDEALVSLDEARVSLEEIGDAYVMSVTYWVEAEIRDQRDELEAAIGARRRELEILDGSNRRHLDAAHRHIADLERRRAGGGNTTGTPAR